MAAPRVSPGTKSRHVRPPQSSAAQTSGGEDMVAATAARIAQKAREPDVTIEELAKLAHADAAFATKLLALVNSPAFARSPVPTELGQAAALLGIRGLRHVALSLLVCSSFPADAACRILLANTLRRAVACRLVASALGHGDLDACFATGLFLESGMLAYAHERLELAVSIASSPAHHRVLREQSEGLSPHPLLGSELAVEYALPGDSVEAILSHHTPDPPQAPLARIAWLGEAVAAVFESADVERARSAAVAQARHIGLGPASVASMLEALPSHVASVAAALDRDVGELPGLESLRNDASRLLSDINQQYEIVVRKLGELLAEKEKLALELQRADTQLASLACTDAFTGLPNRRALEDELGRSAARAARDGTWLGLVALDIDNFKSLNDTHGHAAGDAVLVTIAKVLASACRRGDLPARQGGEEFAIILPNTGPDGAAALADRVRAALEASETRFEDELLKVSTSLGVACAQGTAVEPVQELVARADEALLVAKRSGGNRVVCSSAATLDDFDEDTEITRISALPNA